MKLAETSQLSRLLTSVNCLTYLPLFVDNDITPDLLPSLDRDALIELGVHVIGDRLRLQLLVKILRVQLTKKKLPLDTLKDSIVKQAKTLNQIEKTIGEINDRTIVSSQVITEDGSIFHFRLKIESHYTAGDLKREILCQIFGENFGLEFVSNEWTFYTIEEDRMPKKVYDIELAFFLESIEPVNTLNSKNVLILCHNDQLPTIDAINSYNKLVSAAKKSKRAPGGLNNITELKNFMGQRPPSQLITTNLKDYFPNIDKESLKDVARNSLRLSMYGNDIIKHMDNGPINKRDSMYSQLTSVSKMSRRFSLLSVASIGVGVPIQMNQTVGDMLLSNMEDNGDLETIKSNTTETNADAEYQDPTEDILDDYSSAVTHIKPNNSGDHSIIELMDDSDDDDYAEIGESIFHEEFVSLEAEKVKVKEVLSNEIQHGPTVWHKGAKIGQGSFGFVYLGLNGLTGELMAVKQVDIPHNSNDNNLMIDAHKQEISLLKDLDHENIVRYLGASSDSTRMYIFLEYIPGGSINSMLETYGAFEEPLVKNFGRQVLVGLKYLHSKDIIHRDIKGANILIDNNGVVKISDFGISKKIDGEALKEALRSGEETSEASKRVSLQGSSYWMAPEIVKQEASTNRSDVWSFGCLIIEMLTAKHPYPSFTQMQAIFRIGLDSKPGTPANASEACMEFLQGTFELDWKLRPSATDLLQHRFLTEVI